MTTTTTTFLIQKGPNFPQKINMHINTFYAKFKHVPTNFSRNYGQLRLQTVISIFDSKL